MTVETNQDFSIFQKQKTRELTSYAKCFLGVDIDNKEPYSLSFEEGIDELAKSLNAIRYVYTTSSCGGHIKEDQRSNTSYISDAPYVYGDVWVGYATSFIEGVVNILRNNLLSTIELVIGTPARKRNYVRFGIKCCSIPENKGILLRRQREFNKIAKGLAEIARNNPDPMWYSLLQTNK